MFQRNGRTRVRLLTVVMALLGLGVLGLSKANAEPTVQVTFPQPDQYYAGISEAKGTASGDVGRAVRSVYCMIHYYSVGDYTYRYWNWTTGQWQIGSSVETLKKADFDPVMGLWKCSGGFPATWEPSTLVPGTEEPSRTYALDALAYETDFPTNILAAGLAYFYIDNVPPEISLTVLTETLQPANNEMALAAEVSVADPYDLAPDVEINISSSDVVKASKRRKDEPDWQIVQDGGVWWIWLRAETAGKRKTRLYTIAVQATDAAGNATTASDTVTVVP